MAISTTSIDGWIQHLPFEGGPRPSLAGPVDGVWYGNVSGPGDASGGNVTLQGQLSEARKEDWVYVIQAASATINTLTDQEMFIQLNTGPLIPTSTAVVNPTFNFGGSMRAIANNAISIMSDDGSNTGPFPFQGLPIFGDKRIPGVFLMMAAGFETNVDLALYTMSAWGWLIRYQGFFRNRPPALG